ncbi:MAG: flagellar motor protein MotB [Prolixibacteraceae bacterium]
MKTPYQFSVTLIFILALSLTSCVSTKKFQASEAMAKKFQNDYTNSQSELNNTMVKLNQSNSTIKALKTEGATMQSDYAMAQSDLNVLSSESKMTIADQEKRLNDFQDIIQSQNDVMLKLKNSIADALVNYSSDELYVYIKDGNVYVSMEEKLLFKSGSAAVDPKGKEALKTLSQVINNTKNVMVLIEGHTDNQPIKTNLFKDNWDLSTARATSIVRILTTDFGFDSNRITASGKSYFHPKTTNETPEGRASNRRTEVILSPDLKELYDIVYQ